MNEEIRALVGKIAALEEELRDRLHEQETRVLYELDGRRVRFSAEVAAAQRRLRVGTLRWLAGSNLRNLLSAPFIYGLVLPFALIDLAVTVYQHVCFRLYRIPLVRRSRYVLVDRHQLAYLNSIQKLNCVYCGYANGVVAYVREVASRTEQFWCPIKHARRVTGQHRRYARFLDYGDGEDFEARLAALRAELRADQV
ncbi:MAG: hypothetical protein V2J24_15020 [Pseudomonadales bacterium]|nr:hypothetical protein [Pseudomonadales bacterium]